MTEQNHDANFSEEFLERIGADDVSIGFQARFSECFLEKFGHVQANS
jgi:hypothetical protein